MTQKKPDLSAVLVDAGGGTRHRQATAPQQEKPAPKGQPSREGTKPITAHLPVSVRKQLKALAIEEDTTMQNLISEAFNDLFAKYNKPEICPVEDRKSA